MINRITLFILSVMLALGISLKSAYSEEISWFEKRRQIVEERNLPGNLYGRKDPFAPLIVTIEEEPESADSLPELQLSGIVWSQKSPTAIINSMFVKVGDKVHSRRVVEIRRNEVVLEYNGIRYILGRYGLTEEESVESK